MDETLCPEVHFRVLQQEASQSNVGSYACLAYHCQGSKVSTKAIQGKTIHLCY
jgi:hypothetical protein